MVLVDKRTPRARLFNRGYYVGPPVGSEVRAFWRSNELLLPMVIKLSPSASNINSDTINLVLASMGDKKRAVSSFYDFRAYLTTLSDICLLQWNLYKRYWLVQRLLEYLYLHMVTAIHHYKRL